jgi:hypothetical protein
MSVHQTTGMTGTAPAGGDNITNGRGYTLVIRIKFSNMIIEIMLEIP